jgi:hypothetical protein
MSLIGSLLQATGIALSFWAVWELGGPWPFVLCAGVLAVALGVAVEKHDRTR